MVVSLKFKEIAWDFDGTLYNSYPHIVRCLRLAMEQFGYTDSEENIAKWAHITVTHAMSHYAPFCGCSAKNLNYWYRKFVGETSPLCTPYPGICELLREIVAAGGRNHLCSNRDAQKCRDYFERDGILDCFTVFSGIGPGINSKPAPDLVQAVLTDGNIAPESLLMVGDRNLDVQAAHAAGSKGCFFDLDGYSTPTSDPEYTAFSVEELRKILFD